MIGRTNIGIGELAARGQTVLEVTVPAETTSILCTNQKQSVNGVKSLSPQSGFYVYTFSHLKEGLWTITVKTSANETRTVEQQISGEKETIKIEILFSSIPSFSYSGNYELVKDDDSLLQTGEIKKYKNNWKIRFLTTGTLKISSFNSWNGAGDLFLVGGGHGSGGSGYTRTFLKQNFIKNSPYLISIGGANGGETNISGDGLKQIAPGGKGLDGGSGAGGSTTSWSGNAHANITKNFPGGSDGHSGAGDNKSGEGQRDNQSIPAEFRTTTKEFGDETLPIEKAYSPANGRDGMGKGRTGPNSGAGGNGGQSGILILRNNVRV